MRPNCYNRPPFAEGRWEYASQKLVGHDKYGIPVYKTVLRWRPRWFEDRCVIHDGRGIGPNGENYPAAHGWDCSGCRWEPRKPNIAGNPVVFDESIPPGMFVVNNGNGKLQFIDAFEPIHRSIAK